MTFRPASAGAEPQNEDDMVDFATKGANASLRVMAAVLTLGLALATGSAAAQNAAGGTDDSKPDAWLKVCSLDDQVKKNVCIIKQDLLTNTGQFLASLQLREVEGEAEKSLIAAVPPGMLLQPGLQVQIDKKQATKLKYGICFPNACFAELKVKDDFVVAMKRGGQLVLTTLDQQRKPRPFPFTLIGFTAVYDSEGLDPKQLQTQQQNLRSELERRAEEQRKRLLEQQNNQNQNQ